jgi:hypothetical protein
MTTWKDIKGFEGLYQVSDEGQVRSVDHRTWHRGFMMNKRGKILSVRKDGKGYHQYRLYKYGVSYYPKAHRLVAEHFLENPKNLPQVNHINKDKDDNFAMNLEWCTGQYNIAHSFAKMYVLLSPEGRKHAVKNLRQFCLEYELNQANLHKVFNGERSHSKGWKLIQKL